MKVIVTGGAGFIGSHLVEKLINDSYEVVVLDNFSTGRVENLNFNKNNNLKIVNCDLSKKGSWIKEFNNTELVFHLAALADIVPSITNPESYFYSNVISTLNVLEASRSSKLKKFIYSASSSCYGIPSKLPTPENSLIDPQYPYALTKAIGEELILHWSKIYNLPSISLRLFNVFGTRSRTSGTYGAVFGIFLSQKLSKSPFTIVGNGEQTRDFIYVSDVVNAMIKSAECKFIHKVYNVGSGKTVSVNNIANLIDKNNKKVYIPKRPGEPDCTYADISKISQELNWLPMISINQGINTILDDIHYWDNAPVWTPESIANETKNWFKYLGK